MFIHYRVSNNLIWKSLIHLSYLLETLRLLKGNLVSLCSFFLFSFYFVDPFSVIQHFFWHDELLTHFFEVSAGYLHCDVGRQISVACCFWIEKLVSDPLRELVEIAFAFVPLVSKNHHSIVILRPEYSSNTLWCLTHGIKCEELFVFDIVIFLQELHPCSQVSAESILEWDTEHHHSSSIVSCKIYTLWNFTSCNWEEDCTSSIIACLLVIFKC